MFFAPRLNMKPIAYPSPFCATDDCFKHGQRLLEYINTSVDPCEDFHGFVCGKPEFELKNPGTSFRRLSETIENLIMMSTNLKRCNSSALRNIGMLYCSCINKRADGASVPSFIAFMKDRGVPWPFDPPGNAEPLDVLLDLAINWKVWLWFDLRVISWSRNDTWIVVLGPMNIEAGWWKMTFDTGVTENYANFMRTVAGILDESNSLSNRKLEQLQLDENMVLKSLAEINVDLQEEGFIPLREAAKLTFPVTLKMWLALLNKHLSPTITVTDETMLLIYNTDLLPVLANVISTIERENLLNLIGWMFAASYVWIATTKVDTFETRHRDVFLEIVPPLCYLNLMESFGLLVAAIPFVGEFTDTRRHAVEHTLRDTVYALMKRVDSSRCIVSSTKATAMSKLDKIERFIWPPPDLFETLKLDAFYAKFNLFNEATFFDSWISFRKAFKSEFHWANYSSPVSKGLWAPLESVQYSYSLNALVIALWSLVPPAHYWDGTPSMSFGELGVSLARKLLMVIDRKGRAIDDKLRSNYWWIANENCLWNRPNNNESFLEDLLALELAYDALRSYVGLSNSTHNMPLAPIKDYTGEQVFYMSYCLGKCSNSRAKLLCNTAMNVTGFARSFSCPLEEGFSKYGICRDTDSNDCDFAETSRAIL